MNLTNVIAYDENNQILSNPFGKQVWIYAISNKQYVSLNGVIFKKNDSIFLIETVSLKKHIILSFGKKNYQTYIGKTDFYSEIYLVAAIRIRDNKIIKNIAQLRAEWMNSPKDKFYIFATTSDAQNIFFVMENINGNCLISNDGCEYEVIGKETILPYNTDLSVQEHISYSTRVKAKYEKKIKKYTYVRIAFFTLGNSTLWKYDNIDSIKELIDKCHTDILVLGVLDNAPYSSIKIGVPTDLVFFVTRKYDEKTNCFISTNGKKFKCTGPAIMV